MTIDAIFTLVIAVAALAAKPGAGMMMVMSRSIAGGWSACLMFVVGFCIISIFFLGLVVMGYKYADIDLVFISILIKTVAAVYLIYLGIRGLQNARQELNIEQTKIENAYENLTASIVLTLSNPLTIVFYAGIIPTIINVNQISWNDFFIMSTVIIIVEFAVAIAYCAPLIMFRYKIKQQSLYGLKIFSSTVIILVGLYIGYTAIPAKDLLSVF